MEVVNNLAIGFSVSLSLVNLAYCFLGAALGVFVGVLPGLGSAATIAMLLPVTYYLDTTAAIIMLAGIWYGSMFGGAVTAILLSIPGQSTAVMTVLDGHPLARRGEAGLALGTAIFSSFFGGLIGFLGLFLIAPPLAEFALQFGPPEFFALTLAGLMLVSYLATSSTVKALIAAVLGLLIGCIGIDPVSADERFTLGTLVLQSGVSLVPLIMGLFGVAEVLVMLESRLSTSDRVTAPKGLRSVLPSWQTWRRLRRPITQGGLVGFFTGLLPGAGAAIASYVCYVLIKRWSPARQTFGQGAIEGVAAPEAGNNAATCSGMIPLLTLGLPADIVPAIMLGAFLLHGVTPGPTMMVEDPGMFWGIVTSFLVGNVILVIFMLPLLSPISRITELPSAIIAPLIVLVTLAGAYGINNNAFDITIMIGFGVLGYVMKKFDYPVAPLVLAFVLGPIMEASLRQSLIISRGSFDIFFARPFAGAMMAVAAFLLISPLLNVIRKSDLTLNGRLPLRPK